MNESLKIILSSSIVTTVLTSIFSYFLHKKTERETAALKREFEILSQIQNTDYEWKKKTTELLGQVYIHLNRTRLGFNNKYSKLKQYDENYEKDIMLTSNKKIRDLLIENSHFLPPELLEEASKLIEHYDVWLNKYHHMRTIDKDQNNPHVYVGPEGFQFPDKAEELFKKKYIEMFNELRKHNIEL